MIRILLMAAWILGFAVLFSGHAPQWDGALAGFEFFRELDRAGTAQTGFEVGNCLQLGLAGTEITNALPLEYAMVCS